MSTVYVVQEVPGRNLSAALDYGNMELLLPPNQILLDHAAAIDQLYARLNHFDKEEDWLLLIGDPVAIGLACAVVTDITDGTLRMLKWDRETHRYLPVTAFVAEGS